MTKRTRWFLLAGFVALATLGAIAAVLLRPGLGLLRVQVETLVDDDGHFHRRWTFSGGGRWDTYGQGTRPGEHFVILDRPGLRDPSSIRLIKQILAAGSDGFVYEIEATRIPPRSGTGEAQVRIQRRLAGNSNGSPGFQSSTDVPLPNSPWATLSHATQKNATLTLPARVELGVVGGFNEVIEFR